METRDKVYISIIFIICIIASVFIYSKVLNKKTKETNNSSIVIYISDERGSSEITLSNTIPNGYLLDRYVCSDENTVITQDSDTKTLSMNTIKSSKCKVYMYRGVYTVTFDPNGGTIDTTSKQVTYGRTYGDLPTPTRDGYTFKGWNGVNLLNLEVSASNPSSMAFDKTTKRTFVPNTYVQGLAYNNYFAFGNVNSIVFSQNKVSFKSTSAYGIAFPFLSMPNKDYILSYGIYSTVESGISSIMFYKNDGSYIKGVVSGANSIKKDISFTTPEDTYYLVIEFTANCSPCDTTVSNILLKEGNAVIDYEPYFITSDTTVVQYDNHTLKAIWSQD